MYSPHVLTAMTLLQVLWLSTIWWTEAVANWWKLGFLLGYSIFCRVIIGYIVPPIIAKSRRFKEYLMQHEWLLGVTLSLLAVSVGVMYTRSHLGFPDEGKVFHASRVVAEQGARALFTDYASTPWLGRRHPPLAPLLYGFFMQIFGVKILIMRLLSLLCGVATLLLTYRIGKTLYNQSIGVLAAVLFLATTYFWRLGTTALTDMPVTFFFALSLLLILHLLRRPTYGLAAIVGFCIGVGLLCKYTMVLIYPVLIGYSVISGSLQGPFKRLIPHLMIVILVSVGMLALWLAYAYFNDIMALQQRTLTFYAGAVLIRKKSWKVFEWVLIRVPFGLGVYNLPLILLGGRYLLQRRSQADLHILLWIAAVCVPLLLTLPNPRYFLITFPALSITMACGLARVSEGRTAVVVLALLYCCGAMSLYWPQAKHLSLVG